MTDPYKTKILIERLQKLPMENRTRKRISDIISGILIPDDKLSKKLIKIVDRFNIQPHHRLYLRKLITNSVSNSDASKDIEMK